MLRLGEAGEYAYFLLLQNGALPAAGYHMHGVFPAKPAQAVGGYLGLAAAVLQPFCGAADKILLGDDELLNTLYAHPAVGGDTQRAVLLHPEVYIADGLAGQLIEYLAAVGES